MKPCSRERERKGGALLIQVLPSGYLASGERVWLCSKCPGSPQNTPEQSLSRKIPTRGNFRSGHVIQSLDPCEQGQLEGTCIDDFPLTQISSAANRNQDSAETRDDSEDASRGNSVHQGLTKDSRPQGIHGRNVPSPTEPRALF